MSEFKYLASIFSEDSLKREVEISVQKVISVSYMLAPLLKHPNIPIQTKAKLMNSIFCISTSTYLC